MIYTVTFNPSIDYVVGVKNFNINATNRSEYEKIYAGGKGINVSIVLNNLGVKTKALGFCAGFTGNEIIRLLNEKEISHQFIVLDSGMSRINIKIKNIDTNENVIDEGEINGNGPDISDEELRKFFDQLDALSSDDILVVSGSVPKSLPNNIYGEIAKLACDKKIKVVADTTKNHIFDILKYEPFLIKPNKLELEEMTDSKITNLNDVVSSSMKLRKMGAQNVLTSLGSDGAILVTPDNNVFTAKVPDGKLVNSVGAGDSVVAGFIYGYLQTNNYEAALNFAVCAGSASAYSSELATKKEVYKLYNKMK